MGGSPDGTVVGQGHQQKQPRRKRASGPGEQRCGRRVEHDEVGFVAGPETADTIIDI